MKIKKVVILCGLLTLFINVNGQLTQERIQNFIRSKPGLRSTVKEFYSAMNYSAAWIKPSGQNNRSALIQLLKNASNEGLNQKDYQYEFAESFTEQNLATADGTD